MWWNECSVDCIPTSTSSCHRHHVTDEAVASIADSGIKSMSSGIFPSILS